MFQWKKISAIVLALAVICGIAGCKGAPGDPSHGVDGEARYEQTAFQSLKDYGVDVVSCTEKVLMHDSENISYDASKAEIKEGKRDAAVRALNTATGNAGTVELYAATPLEDVIPARDRVVEKYAGNKVAEDLKGAVPSAYWNISFSEDGEKSPVVFDVFLCFPLGGEPYLYVFFDSDSADKEVVSFDKYDILKDLYRAGIKVEGTNIADGSGTKDTDSGYMAAKLKIKSTKDDYDAVIGAVEKACGESIDVDPIPGFNNHPLAEDMKTMKVLQHWSSFVEGENGAKSRSIELYTATLDGGEYTYLYIFG